MVTVYTLTEQDLVAESSTLVREALTAPAGSLPRVLLYARLRRAADTASEHLRARVQAMATRVVDTAARNGNATAAREVPRVPADVFRLLPHDVNAARIATADLASRLDAAAERVTRFADDAYRAATISSTIAQILEKATPAEAQAQAWRELTAKGVTGFTDKSGRDWNLATYVEMAVRTATQRAFNASHRDRLTQAGVTLFTISTTGRPCPLCAPWEGRVLADRGAGTYTEPDAAGNGTVAVEVAATVEEATAAGLFHPNCKHTLTAYLPGVTVLRPNTWSAADEQAYRASQQLRALEAQVRRYRQQATGALTPLEKARANAAARTTQARIRAHTTGTGLLRRPRREQPQLGNKP